MKIYALERISDSVKVQTWNALPGKLNLKPHGIAKVISPPHVGMEVDGFRVIEFQRPAAPIDVNAQINCERDRRIAAGITFGGKVFQTDERSMRRIGDVARQASAAIANGVQANNLRWHGGEADFTFTAADNTSVNMDAPTMEAFGNAVLAHELKIIGKARALKDRPGGPPEDYAADVHWT